MKDEILKIMSDVFDLDLFVFSGEINQQNIENWDSLRHLNLIVELEEYFSVSFEPEDISEMSSINMILEVIQKKKNES